MAFKTDTQTLKDLEVFPVKKNASSIFDFYNRTATNGGKEILYRILNTPIVDPVFLENRKREILFFSEVTVDFRLNRRQLDFIEFYLQNRRIPLKANIIDATKDSLVNKIKTNSDYYIIAQGILNSTYLLKDLRSLLDQLKDLEKPDSLNDNYQFLEEYIEQEHLVKILDDLPGKYNDFKPMTINRLDNFFRQKSKNEFRKLLDIIYDFDVFFALGSLIKEDGFKLPEFVQGSDQIFDVADCFHPFLDKPVKNNFKLENGVNLYFITGPNMSGKSTFLKTVGLLIYLSHLGLPVPAKHLKTSLFNGLYTTINISDSLSQGFSHFLTEVKRIKEMSERINTSNNLVIIMDELFRGTNVKDAYDATLMVVKLLAQIKNSVFIISSHILEVAEDLKGSELISFKCFEAELEASQLKYDYKLINGISEERVGLHIMENEGIKSILEALIK